jgi:hypothetical protein
MRASVPLAVAITALATAAIVGNVREKPEPRIVTVTRTAVERPRAVTATACHTIGQPPFTRPDTGCTPGTARDLNRQQTCATKDRPDLSEPDHRKILAEYGVPGWTGRDGELDHRIPFFLGGRTEEDNVWPERGPIPNQKDRLERAIYERVCDYRDARLQWHGSMTPAAARKLFRGNWVFWFKRYVDATP